MLLRMRKAGCRRAGRLALIRLSSPCQVHPVIATRWSGSLKGKNLLSVMVRPCCFFRDTSSASCRLLQLTQLASLVAVHNDHAY